MMGPVRPPGCSPPGRATLLHLTDAGRQRTDQLWNTHRQQIADVVDHLTDEQKIALSDILDALGQASTQLLDSRSDT